MSVVDETQNLDTSTSATDQAQIDWEAADNPYRKRYEDLRPEADRRQSELDRTQSLIDDLRGADIERQRAAAAQLGFELAEEEPETYDDPSDALRAEIEALKGQFGALTKEREQQRISQAVESALDTLELDEGDKDWVLARAISLPTSPDGLPDLEAAYAQLQERDQKAMQRWAASKKAPRTIASGKTATETKNVAQMTNNERVEYMTQMLEERSA